MSSVRLAWWAKHVRLIDRVVAYAGLASVLVGLTILALFIIRVVYEGGSRISIQFLTSFPSRIASEAGILSAWVGTLWVVVLCALLAVPIGIAAAIYLEEYAIRTRLGHFLEINIANLAGVPSIIYGLLGLTLFVRALGMGRSVLAGSATLALLVLPVIILSTREALRAVPFSIRESSYALGATRWQTIWHQILPASLPGILTGVILAISRALGETAPLIMIGALTYVAFLPSGIHDSFTVLPIQIFNWVSRPSHAFAANASAGVVVLLCITGVLNGMAMLLRHRYRQKFRW